MKFVYFKLHFIYPPGKPMPPHLLRCQGIAVGKYSFILGRLEAGAPSTFAHLVVPLKVKEFFESVMSKNLKMNFNFYFRSLTIR
jgi:hypothetical protein